jgi:hypothetical protein
MQCTWSHGMQSLLRLHGLNNHTAASALIFAAEQDTALNQTQRACGRNNALDSFILPTPCELCFVIIMLSPVQVLQC